MSKRTNEYTLQVYRNKSYRTVCAGKESKCFRRLPGIFSRCRIQRNGETVQTFAALPERFQSLAA